jgi:hypothetical protein
MKEKIIQVIGVIIGLILIPVLISWGMKLSKKHEEEYPWKASIFLISDTANIIDSKDVKTVEECRMWVTDRASILAYKDDEWDYNCGRGCKYKEDNIAGGKEVHSYECEELSQ